MTSSKNGDLVASWSPGRNVEDEDADVGGVCTFAEALFVVVVLLLPLLLVLPLLLLSPGNWNLNEEVLVPSNPSVLSCGVGGMESSEYTWSIPCGPDLPSNETFR